MGGRKRWWRLWWDKKMTKRTSFFFADGRSVSPARWAFRSFCDFVGGKKLMVSKCIFGGGDSPVAMPQSIWLTFDGWKTMHHLIFSPWRLPFDIDRRKSVPIVPSFIKNGGVVDEKMDRQVCPWPWRAVVFFVFWKQRVDLIVAPIIRSALKIIVDLKIEISKIAQIGAHKNDFCRTYWK